MTEAQLRERLTDVTEQIAALDTQYEAQWIDPESEDGKKFNELLAESKEIKKTLAQLELRRKLLAEAASKPENTSENPLFNTRGPNTVTGQDIFDLSTLRVTNNPQDMLAELQDRATRAIDEFHFPHERADEAACKAQITKILNEVEEPSIVARRILHTGSSAYGREFGSWLRSRGQDVGPRMQAAMQVGVDADGGFAVPVQLDPTLIPTTDGAVNPYRGISRVEQTTAKEWQGVTRGAVTATRRAEDAETTDSKLDLDGPTARPSRVDVFMPFTIALQISWSGMQSEVAGAIQEAKDEEEVQSFTNGDGTANTGGGENPEGILTGATETVEPAGAGAFTSQDLDAVENALGSRFRARAQWLGERSIFNTMRGFESVGADYLISIGAGLGNGRLNPTPHGYVANECSAMPTTFEDGEKFLVLGDFTRFLIVDKIGLNMEVVPHVMGANGRPTGKRGFYAYWFNTAKVLVPNAFRVLEAAPA